MSEFIIDDRETPRFRVNRRAFVSPEVFDDEREKVFDKSWLYVGHESEIPRKNDYQARRVGGRPVIFTRDTDGGVRVFFNSCTHRGAMLCRDDEGNGRFLKCFYHAWSFDTAGNLVAMPDDESYGPNFDRNNLCLVSPPRVESYRGFVFLSYDPGIVDLTTYLAGARGKLDHICDQSIAGMEIMRGTHKYSMRANWKLLVENSMDGYHAQSTHARYLQMMRKRIEKMMGGAVPDLTRAMASLTATQGGWDLGNGHTINGGPPRPGGMGVFGRMLGTEELRAKEQARLAERQEYFGEEYFPYTMTGGNMLIFPNLLIIDLGFGITVRKIDPTSEGYIEITAWELAPSDEDPALRACRADDFLTFWGPGGMATPDDVEALEVCHLGYASNKELRWNDISRGMSRVPSGSDEYHMRTFWRRWNQLMTGEYLPPEDQAAEPDWAYVFSPRGETAPEPAAARA